MNKIKYYLWLYQPVIIIEFVLLIALAITLLLTGCVNSSSLGLN